MTDAHRLRPCNARALCLAAAGLALVGCAKKEPPSGGPPDLESPRLVSSVPDSGAAGVPVDVTPTLTFSEGMEPRSSAEAVSFAPPLEIRQRRWRGRTLVLVMAKPLVRDRIYTMFVAGTARDRHGNNYGTGKTVVFSTGPLFPPGLIEGKIDARGFAAGGSYVWVYDQAQGHAPDSTARDFDALGLAQDDGSFRVSGLKVPGRYRLWTFADLNGNRSFEPASDILAAIDTTFDLTAESPRASGVELLVVNPRAPGTVSGTVVDSLADSTGIVHVVATSAADTTKRVLVQAGGDGTFELKLDGGKWRVRAFRDLDADRVWQPGRERASALVELDLEPAALVTGFKLTLGPRPGGP